MSAVFHDTIPTESADFDRSIIRLIFIIIALINEPYIDTGSDEYQYYAKQIRIIFYFRNIPENDLRSRL